jgi:23S rRNA pseudouridine955/2504/2580 synthase
MLLVVNQDFVNLRLDKFLCQKFDLSFGIAQKLIREKKVKVNDKKIDASYKIKESDQIEIFSKLENRLTLVKTKPKISDKKITEFLSYVIYQDENLVAINKPSGLAVQGGSGIEISVDDFLSAGAFPKGAALVHRLDKDTSGILLIALNKKAADFLTDKFRSKTISKTYLALVCGNLKKELGTINIPLLKKFIGKNEKVRPDFEGGKEAITNYKLIKNFEGYAALELMPITGRTHQLRVHCKEIGNAIVNDIKYGLKDAAAVILNKPLANKIGKRLCLHAYRIEIEDYFGKVLRIETKRPEFFAT